ncbi:MAG: hypothetical protein R3293_12110 [Candidatus Promineifilaceae bacterium]|nr:hypothetical protein [Candidatus Promineifilaceae bacterium]
MVDAIPDDGTLFLSQSGSLRRPRQGTPQGKARFLPNWQFID